MVERKLVTILSADVAEYSRLMAEDEEQTLRIFRDHSQTFRALVDLYHGRIFNTAGDAILAEFTSPVEAVRCATEIQAALRTRNDQLPLTRQVKFRIGVNLGDVMVQNSDLLGDGVNVAARLQGAAAPGGICISGSVYDQIRNKLTLGFESLGERRFKNIPQPVRTFTIAGTGEDSEQPSSKKSFGRPGILIKSIVAVLSILVLAGGYWTYSARRQNPAPDEQAPAVADLSSTDTQVDAKDVARSLLMESNALLAEAQRLRRPAREIQALTNSNTKIVALTLQLHELGKNPGEAAKAGSLNVQVNDLAADMSRSEATALARASKILWRDMEQPPGKIVATDAAAAIAAASQAKTKLDDAVAAVQNTQDAIVSLTATKQALAAYDAFTTAYGTAAQFYIVARRSDFSALAAAAHGASDQLTAFGKISKPWVLASRARREAYKSLADNATEASTLVAQLDVLERETVTANDLRKLSGALTQALAIKNRLDGLLVSSNAARGVYNQ
jgi:class 3 adenylate cyclase